MTAETSIVRIRMEDRTVVGAGFLVDEQHIFTCAHVVTQSLRLPEDIPDAPQAPIWLDFPLVAPKKLLTATVVQWLPKQDDESGDIAVLELQGDLPEGVEPACFAEAEDFWHHEFRAFGFPIGQDDGVWATGQLLGKQATNWIMIEDVKEQGFAVIQGFSGGPVWDTQLEGVVGMVVASSKATETVDTKTAFVIPLDVLNKAWKISSPMMNQRVFLSYAPGDAAFAQQLSDDLQKHGIIVWNEQKGPDNDPTIGEERLRRAIRSSQAVIFVVSPLTRSSRKVNEHLRLANFYKRQLILFWVGDEPNAKPQQYGWRETTWIDTHQTSYSSALETLEASLYQERLTSIAALLGPPDESSQPEPRNPYKGLRFFTVEDTKDFFGRDRFVDELVKNVQEMLATDQVNPAQGRLFALIGPSGSGKSSVLMAGLLPKLEQGTLPGSAEWIYLETMVPGKHPLERLALALKPYFPDSSIKTLREDLDDDATRGLHLLATQLVKKNDTRVVLVVDQFEELFTQTETEAERRQFVDLLLTATTEAHGPIVVLLTIRADFYDRPMQYPELNRLLQAHLRQVLPMDVEDLRATIEQPAALPDVRLTFEGNLVGDLLFEIQGQVGALPLLQFTLYQLFERRSGHRLTLQAYHEIGGVRGALAQHAEKTFTSLPTDEHRRLAQALFLRLIEPGATEQDTTRRRAALTEFVFDNEKQTKVMGETIDAFVSARLLMTNDIAGVQTLEVSHEAVIREWPRLATWIQEAREDIPLQQAVSKDVEEWEHYGKPKDRLYRGTQLKEAKAWSTRYMVSEREMAFLHAGELQQKRSKLFRVTIIFLLLILAMPIGFLGIPQLISLGQQNNLLPITVTSLNDNGLGSLRAAIQTASPKNYIIHFDPGLKGKTIMLTNNLIIEKSLILQGSGVTISSGVHDYQISVNSGYSVTMENLAFKQGMLKGNHFIHNYGTLELDNTTISENSIKGTHINLIYNDGGRLTISKSTISKNSIIGANTALIYNDRGQLTISNSAISDNIGEIYNNGQLMITNSIITNMNRNNPDKTSVNNPPPIYNDSILTIKDSTIADNISYFNGDGIFNGGQMTISGSTISGNSFLSGTGSERTNSGGGIANDVGATLTITNSTIAGNTAGESGGGIANWGDMLMSFCTVYGNSARAAGGIAVLDGSLKLSNSILAGNIVPTGKQLTPKHIKGTLISQGYNLIQNMTNIVPRPATTPDSSNIAVSRFITSHDTTVSASEATKIFDPLGLQYFDSRGLQTNSGRSRTYKLFSGQGNPAIDKIPLADCHPILQDASGQPFTITTDQRGMPRPGGYKRSCDVGAYESTG